MFCSKRGQQRGATLCSSMPTWKARPILTSSMTCHLDSPFQSPMIPIQKAGFNTNLFWGHFHWLYFSLLGTKHYNCDHLLCLWKKVPLSLYPKGLHDNDWGTDCRERALNIKVLFWHFLHFRSHVQLVVWELKKKKFSKCWALETKGKPILEKIYQQLLIF